jgi:hypothetical protein
LIDAATMHEAEMLAKATKQTKEIKTVEVIVP